MRAILLVGLFLTGAMTMIIEAVEAQEKKEEKFPEKVTVRSWDAKGKQFLNPKENVPARRRESKDEEKKTIFDISAIFPRAITKGTEITDADGVVWVATENSGSGSGNGYYIVRVEKKEPPKKD